MAPLPVLPPGDILDSGIKEERESWVTLSSAPLSQLQCSLLTLEDIDYIDSVDRHDEIVKLVRFCSAVHELGCDLFDIGGEDKRDKVQLLLDNAFCLAETAEIVVCSIAMVLAVAVIIINIVGLVVLAKHRSLKSPTNRFFISLAVSDVVFGVTSIYSTTMNLLMAVAGKTYDYVMLSNVLTLRGNKQLCLLVDMPGLLYASMMAIVLTLMAIASEKYITIFHPLKYYRFMTRCRIALMVVVIWAISLLFGFMPLMGWNEYDGTCLVVEKTRTGYLIAWASVCLVSAVATLFMYARIFWTARKHARQIRAQTEAVSRAHTSEAPQTEFTYALNAINATAAIIGASKLDLPGGIAPRRSEGQLQVKRRKFSWRRTNSQSNSRPKMFSAPIRAVKTIAIILGTFYVCWLPLIIYLLVMHEKYSNFILYSITMLTLINGLTNPIVYGFRNKNIRSKVRTLCQCINAHSKQSDNVSVIPEAFSTHYYPS